MYCSKCGEELNKKVKFCTNCGETVSTAVKEKPHIQKEAKFCPYCGSVLDKGTGFCKNCGEVVISSKRENKENINERKVVYEGNVHKCPNCGEVLDSFLTVCPSCGYELRDVQSGHSVQELAQKLEIISAQKMPPFKEKKSVMKMIFGKDFKDEDEEEEALDRFEEHKEQEKASLIINFFVPNTKEDILEFMMLAASNIDVRQSLDNTVTKAWITKLEQVYQRAEISMSGQPEFARIKEIYDRKKAEMKNKKLKSSLIIIAAVALWFFLFGLLCNPTITLTIFTVVLVLIIIGIIIYKKK